MDPGGSHKVDVQMELWRSWPAKLSQLRFEKSSAIIKAFDLQVSFMRSNSG